MNARRILPIAIFCGATLLGIRSSYATVIPITVQNGGFEQVSAPGVSAQLGSHSTSTAGSVIQNATGWTSGLASPATPGNPAVLGYNFLFTANSTTAANGEYGNSYGSQYGFLSMWGKNTNGTSNGIGASPNGGNFLAMDGAFEQASVSQVITGLTVGMDTKVYFYYAGAQQSGFSGVTTETFLVSLSDGSHTETHAAGTLDDASHGFTGWHYTEVDFTPTSTTETLSFLASGTPNGLPPFSLLDGISIVQVTPEPSSLALLGTGILSLGMLARRRFIGR